MNIFALDTCGPMLSLAVRHQGRLFEYAFSAGFRHAQLLLPSMDTLFHTAGILPQDLDLIACIAGPGSFTGLRIGMATARGLSLSHEIPLVLLSSLQVYAFGLHARRVLAVLDARKQRFYVAMANEQGKLISDEYDADLECIAALLEKEKTESDILLSGPGAALLYEQLSDKNGIILDTYALRPRASVMIDLAEKKWHSQGACADDEGPHYLRESDAVQGRFHSS